MNLTRSQQAAAFHGLATNRGYQVAERLELALQALKLYELEVESLQLLVQELEDKQKQVDT